MEQGKLPKKPGTADREVRRMVRVRKCPDCVYWIVFGEEYPCEKCKKNPKNKPKKVRRGKK